jgi:hypothetical protein
MRAIALGVLLFAASIRISALSTSGFCMISTSSARSTSDTLTVVLSGDDCGGHECADFDSSSMDSSRWTGISPKVLQENGTAITAKLTGDAGELVCIGMVRDEGLAGRYHFTPYPTFPAKMKSLGFDGITPSMQMSFLILNITTSWVTEMKDLGVTDLSTAKLFGLRALHIDANYIEALSAAGYTERDAGRLTEMKAVGVTPEKAREARSLGFAPSEEELIEMCIFHIDRPFVERIRAEGLHGITLDKLIKIKVFKLDQ